MSGIMTNKLGVDPHIKKIHTAKFICIENEVARRNNV